MEGEQVQGGKPGGRKHSVCKHMCGGVNHGQCRAGQAGKGTNVSRHRPPREEFLKEESLMPAAPQAFC